MLKIDVKARKERLKTARTLHLTRDRDEARTETDMLQRLADSRRSAVSERMELAALLDRAEGLLGDTRAENQALRLQQFERFQTIDTLGAQLLEARNDALRYREEARTLTHTAAQRLEATNEATAELARLRSECESLVEAVAHHRNKEQGLAEQVTVLTDKMRAAQETIKLSEAAADQARTLLSTLTQRNQYLTDQAENAKRVQADLVLVRAELEAATGLAAWYRSKEELQVAETQRQAAEVARLTAEIASVANADLLEARKCIDDISRQVFLKRSARSTRLAYFLARDNHSWQLINPLFSEVRAYAEEHFRRSTKTMFGLGEDLRTVPFVEYEIPFRVPTLRSVTLGLQPFVRPGTGMVGIELVSANQIVAHVTIPVAVVRRDAPTEFTLPAPIGGLEAGWRLRVFAVGVDVPIAAFELNDYSLLRRRIRNAPFALFR